MVNLQDEYNLYQLLGILKFHAVLVLRSLRQLPIHFTRGNTTRKILSLALALAQNLNLTKNLPETLFQQIAGGVSEKLGRTASDLRGALASQAANASSSWKRFRSSGDERGRDFSDGDGDGRYSRHERKAAYTGEADVYEGEPLLREEVSFLTLHQRYTWLCVL